MGTPSSPIPSLPVVIGEVVGAVLGGGVLAIASYFVPYLLLAGADLGMGLLSLQVFAAIVGFGVGAGLGVALAGQLAGQPGRPWLAVVSALFTGGAVILVMRLLNITLGGLFGIAGVAAPLVILAAVVAYNLRR